MARAVMEMLTRIMNGGTTIVMVTHSEEHAKRAHRVVNMLDGRLVDSTEA
jgi:putative ABC transport system ATP-binding protein